MAAVTQTNPVRLFVTHGWEADEDYVRVFEYLESANNFFYRNCSAPETPPGGTLEAQRETLRRQIAPAEVVIATAGLAARQRDALLFQMTFAKAGNKPVILLGHFGVQAPLPKALTDLADEVIDWDTRALVDAIKLHARQEKTGRWDVIEFKLD